MVPLYGLKVSQSTPELRVKDNPSYAAQLTQTMKDLPTGMYLLRIIQEKYNHKLEEKGHSAIYIKRETGEYYFDPALGAHAIFSDPEKPHLVLNALISANHRFGVDIASFHRLQEAVSISTLKVKSCDPLCRGTLYFPEGKERATLPLIIFSPGLAVAPMHYQDLVEEIAKAGFVVMLLDLARPLQGQILTVEEIIAKGKQDAKTLVLLIDAIRAKKLQELSHVVPVALVGHSLGGSSSIEACRLSDTFCAAVNLDGRVLTVGKVAAPVLQLVATKVSEDRTPYNMALSALQSANPTVQIEKLDVKHGDFSHPDTQLLPVLAAKITNFLTTKM